MASYVKRLSTDIVEGLIGADFIDGLLSDDIKNAKGLADAAKLRADSAYYKAGSNSSHAHTSNQVGSASSGLSTGSVGSYALLYYEDNGVLSIGATAAGSKLRYASTFTSNAGGGPNFTSGTWRCMGQVGAAKLATTTAISASTTLWMRIL